VLHAVSFKGGEGGFKSPPNSQSAGPPLAGRLCLLNTFAAIIHIWRLYVPSATPGYTMTR